MLKLNRRDGLLVLLHRSLTLLPLLITVVLALVVPAEVRGQEASSSKMKLTTTSFTPGGFIPKRFTCEAADVSPALTWTDPPPGTRSFAIIEDDPDAPSGTFVHWVVYDLPAAYRKLPEALSGNDQMSGGGRQGTNDFSRTGYSGPCPPPGKPHRYFIRLYAVGVILNLPPAATRKELDEAMQSHILARGELMGRFAR
ncbi:MAG: YbhB/YbcL family Raf kinase inhibitor-like protein [Terriglobia bacterium]